jgi:hypothetical protein
MLRRDTFVIEIFQSVPEKNARGEFIPPGRRQSDRRLPVHRSRIDSAP